jgi:hypothetical protein
MDVKIEEEANRKSYQFGMGILPVIRFFDTKDRELNN